MKAWWISPNNEIMCGRIEGYLVINKNPHAVLSSKWLGLCTQDIRALHLTRGNAKEFLKTLVKEMK